MERNTSRAACFALLAALLLSAPVFAAAVQEPLQSPFLSPQYPTSKDKITCDYGCTGFGGLALEYLWHVDEAPFGSWEKASGPVYFDCREQGCVPGQKLRLDTRMLNESGATRSSVRQSRNVTLGYRCDLDGEPCADGSCCAGLYCDTRSKPKTCKPPSLQGQPCSTNSNCAAGLECYKVGGITSCTMCVGEGGTIRSASALSCCPGLSMNPNSHACSAPKQQILMGQTMPQGGSEQLYYVTGPEGMASAVALAIFGTLLLIALVYMGGIALENVRMTTWSKQELAELAFSVVAVGIVTLIIAAFSSANAMELASLASPRMPAIYANLSAYDAAQLYLEYAAGTGLRNIANIRSNVGAYEVRVSYQKYECKGLCFISLTGQTLSVYAETIELAIANGMLGTATTAYLAILFQMFTLSYIREGLFIFLLPLAIVMRSIPFMRGLGGALIGIVVAMYVLYPAMLLVDAVSVPAIASGLGQISVPDRDEMGCAGIAMFTGYDGTSSITCVSARPESKLYVASGAALMADSIRTAVLGWLPDSWANTIEPYVPGSEIGVPRPSSMIELMKLNSLVFIVGIFMPAFNFIVIAMLARDLSGFFGEAAEISKLGQMI